MNLADAARKLLAQIDQGEPETRATLAKIQPLFDTYSTAIRNSAAALIEAQKQIDTYAQRIAQLEAELATLRGKKAN